jgi:hypothetical protein
LPFETANDPYIAPATFVFDSKNVLVDLFYADSYKNVHVEHGPESFACVKAPHSKKVLAIIGDGVIRDKATKRQKDSLAGHYS